jgi:hypothetical protein
MPQLETATCSTTTFGTAAQQPLVLQHNNRWYCSTTTFGTAAQQPLVLQHNNRWYCSTTTVGTAAQQPLVLQQVFAVRNFHAQPQPLQHKFTLTRTMKPLQHKFKLKRAMKIRLFCA